MPEFPRTGPSEFTLHRILYCSMSMDVTTLHTASLFRGAARKMSSTLPEQRQI